MSRADAADASSENLVVVAGAGAAGMAAAISAARAGANVYLLERGSRPGGTVTHALIHTLGGIYDDAGDFLNDGIVRELAESLEKASPSAAPRRIGRTWTLSVCPDTYHQVVRDWLEKEPRLELLPETRVQAGVAEGGEVREVEAQRGDRTLRLRPRAVIDATGTAELVRLIDPALIHDDDERAAGGLILRIRGVEPGALDFPKGARYVRALHRAAAEGALPPECGKAWLDRGAHPDEVYVKLFVPLLEGWREREERGEVTRETLRARDPVLAILAGFPEFAAARLWSTGSLGVRDGGRIKGEYELTESDVREGRRFPDAAARCAWPIEYWDPRKGVKMEYLEAPYEIPLRCLAVRGFANLWAAGKCLSAEHRAQASARVVGSCWTMGEAVGQAAAAAAAAAGARPSR